jgi:RHS repeat-associated protein
VLETLYYVNYFGNYFEWQIVADGEFTTTQTTKYYYAGGTRVAMQRGEEGTKYLLGDHLGSASVVLNADGTALGAQGYLPWGEVNFTEGTIDTEYMFTGQYSYESFGLAYFNARWYDSSIGRFAQSDTIVPQASQGTQAWDRYAGLNNNPIKYTDPSGNCSGSPDDPENTEEENKCWEQWKKLSEKYTNITFDKTFTLSELLIISIALGKVLAAFGSMTVFVFALGNFSFARSPSAGIGAWTVPPALRKVFGTKINLGDRFFTSDNLGTVIRWIIHEIGHIFDFNGSSGAEGYKSSFFANGLNKVANCSPGAVGCLGANPDSGLYGPIDALTGGGGLGQYDPIGTTTEYGKNNGSVEDFADSFANYVLLTVDSANSLVDKERLAAIAAYIAIAQREAYRYH